MSLMSRFSLLATQREALGRRFAQGDDHEEHGESSERDKAAARGGGVLDEAERGRRTEDDRTEDDRTEDDRTTGLASETGAFSSANLKLVFDLEYRAPDWSDSVREWQIVERSIRHRLPV